LRGLAATPTGTAGVLVEHPMGLLQQRVRLPNASFVVSDFDGTYAIRPLPSNPPRAQSKAATGFRGGWKLPE